MSLFPVTSHGGTEETALWGLFYLDTNPRTCPPWPNSLQRLCLQTPSHWELVLNIWMWEDTNMLSIIVVDMCHYRKVLKTILETMPRVGIFWIGSFFSDRLPQRPFFRKGNRGQIGHRTGWKGDSPDPPPRPSSPSPPPHPLVQAQILCQSSINRLSHFHVRCFPASSQ